VSAPIDHGLRGYTQAKCRCEVCRAAWAAYYRDYARRRRANGGKPLKQGQPKRDPDPFSRRAGVVNARGKKFQSLGHVTGRQLRELVESYGEVCAYCGRPWEVIDHFIPIAKGGSSSIQNLRPACARCNRLKKASLLEEWKPWLSHAPRGVSRHGLRRFVAQPDVAFGSMRTNRWYFPTAGWDSDPHRKGSPYGRGFRIFPETHGVTITRKGGFLTKVAGVSHYGRVLRSRDVDAGRPLVLAAKPHVTDSNAVEVLTPYGRRRVGFVPRELAPSVKAAIENGKVSHALCVWEWLLDKKRVGVVLLIAPGVPHPRVTN
jgi:5-methylcytosine-specific restriction endonuclease McrA